MFDTNILSTEPYPEIFLQGTLQHWYYFENDYLIIILKMRT